MSELPQQMWTVHLEQAILQLPQAVGDTLFLTTKLPEQGSKHSAIHAVNLIDGATLWQHTFEYAFVNGLQPYHLKAEQQAIVVVATGSSNLLRGQGSIYAFTPSGSIIWQWQGESQQYSAPSVKERQLFVNAGTNTLLIISPEAGGKNGTGDGIENNAVQMPLPVTASLAAPAIHGSIIYISCRTPDLLALSLNGDILWQFQAQGHKADWLDQTPILFADTLYTVSRRGTIFALHARSGKLLWQHSLGDDRPLSRPAVDRDRLYVGSKYGLHVLDPNSGQTIWTFPTTRPISASPLLVGEIIYVACEDHHLYALESHNGEELWRLEMPRRLVTTPILTPTCLLVTDRGGTIVALEPPVQSTTSTEREENKSSDQEYKQAETYEIDGDFSRAAQLWSENGALEKAAITYEKGNYWREAAELWQKVDRLGKRAEALEKYAASLTAATDDPETMAVAWEDAARAHAEIGQREDRRRCEKKVAYYRKLPILTMEIEPEPLVKGSWSKISYTVQNVGFGSARSLSVKLVGDRFDGYAKQTQTIITLTTKRPHRGWFDVSPNVSGLHVPLQLVIEYIDKADNIYRLEKIFHVSVAQESEGITPSTAPGENLIFARLVSPDGRNLPHFRQQMITYFSSEEVDDIIFDLHLHVDDFARQLSPKVRRLIIWAVQNNQLSKLIEICRERRPKVDW